MTPSLDTVISNPQVVESMTAPAIGSLLVRIAALQGVLAARLAGLSARQDDELLSVEQLAKMIGQSKGTIYNNRKLEPFKSAARKVGSRVLFSKQAILAAVRVTP